MRKLMTLALVLVLALSCLSLIACGGGEKKDEAPPAGFTWADIPIYSGASQIEKITTMHPGPEFKDFENSESRYYETSDGVKKVASFYKAEMLKRGWQDTMTMESEEFCGIVWEKEDADVVAVLTIGEAEDGVTNIIIVRYEGKK